MDDVTDKLLTRRRQAVRGRDGEADRRGRVAARGRVTGRPPTIESVIPDELEPAIAKRIERATEEQRRPARSGRRTRRCGAATADTPELADRLGWLTIAERMIDQCGELAEFADGCREDGLTDVGAARHGRLEPRARGVPAVVREARRTGSSCTCWTRPTRARSGPPRSLDLTKTLFLVSSKSAARSRRSRSTSTSGEDREVERRRGAQLRRDHRPGSKLADIGREGGLPRRYSSTTRRSAAVTGRCRTSGSCPLRFTGPMSEDPRPRAGRRGGVRELQPLVGQLGPVAGPRHGRAGAGGPRQVHVRRRRADRQVRPLGRAADRGVARQGGQGSLPMADEPIGRA